LLVNVIYSIGYELVALNIDVLVSMYVCKLRKVKKALVLIEAGF